MLYVREFGYPSPVTLKYVIIVTRDVSFINICSLAVRSVANRLALFSPCWQSIFVVLESPVHVVCVHDAASEILDLMSNSVFAFTVRPKARLSPYVVLYE